MESCYTLLLSPTPATFLDHILVRHVIILVTANRMNHEAHQYAIISSLFFFTSFLLCPHILLKYYFSAPSHVIFSITRHFSSLKVPVFASIFLLKGLMAWSSFTVRILVVSLLLIRSSLIRKYLYYPYIYHSPYQLLPSTAYHLTSHTSKKYIFGNESVQTPNPPLPQHYFFLTFRNLASYI